MTDGDGDMTRDHHLLSVTVTCAGCHSGVTRGATDHPDVMSGDQRSQLQPELLYDRAPGSNCRWPMFVTDTRPTPANKYLLRQNTNSKIGQIPHTRTPSTRPLGIS